MCINGCRGGSQKRTESIISAGRGGEEEREREGERNMPGNRAVARDFIASNEHFGD